METRREPLEVGSLQLLVALAQAGSLRSAAAQRGLSEPAASRRLRDLEAQLGLHLVERSPRGSHLTPAGTAVVGWAARVLDALGDLDRGAAALRAGRSSQLRIAASLTVAEYLLPGWLAAPALEGVAVALRMANSAEVPALLLASRVELGFVEGVSAPAGLQGRTVWRDRLAVVVAPGHPWARRRTPLAPAHLGEVALISREPGSGTRQVLDRALAQCGVAARIQPELASTTAIKASAMAGLGPAVLSHLAVETELAERRLVEVPVAGLRLERAIRALWRREGSLAEPARRLLAAIPALRAG